MMADVYFKCCICNQIFLDEGSHYRHKELCLKNYASSKNNENVILCICGEKFRKKSSYYDHRRLCAEAQIKLKNRDNTNKRHIFKTCNCGKNFKSKSRYYVHRKVCAEAQMQLSKNENTDEGSIFKTCHCGKHFKAKTTYYNHKRVCAEAQRVKLEENEDIINEGCIFKTCNCGKKFKSKSTYYKHTKKCDKVQQNDQKISQEYYICQEKDCSFTCYKHSKFVNHLKEIHSIESCWEEKNFETHEEFEDWKEYFEKTTKASYICFGASKSTIGTTKYFKCNRSGFYESKATRKRAMKSQGMTKIGFNCTSKFKALFIENSTLIKCTICNSHYGHEKNLLHLRLSNRDKAFLANQLTTGKEYSCIQRNILNVFTNELERLHLTTKKDLRNISRAYGINRAEKYQEEDIDVDAYLDENLMEEKGIVLNKQQEGIRLYYPPNLTDIKSELITEVTSLCDSLKKCDDKDLLLTAKSHIDNATSLLSLNSRNTEMLQN